MSGHSILRSLSFLIFIVMCCSVRFSAAQELGTEAIFERITPASLPQVELGYALDTRCGTFSPNGTLLAVSGDGLYDLVTGKRRFEISGPEGFYPDFSPDNRYLATYSDGMYDVNTGEKILEFTGKSPFFSPDGSLLAVGEDGVYDVQTRKMVLHIEQELSGPYPDPIFSPDGSLLAATRDGVYDLVNRYKLYDTHGFYLSFSSDSRWFVTDEGVYDARTGNLQVAVCKDCQAVAISPSSTLLAISGDGLYDAPSFRKRFSIGNIASMFTVPTFNPDESLVVTDAVYDVNTGEQLALVSVPGSFSQDGSLFAASGDYLYHVSDWNAIVRLEGKAYFGLDDSVVIVAWDGIYDISGGQRFNSIATGYTQFNPTNTLITVENYWISGRRAHEWTSFCLIYGLPDSKRPYRSGLAHISERVNLRSKPSRNSSIVTTTSDTDLPIFATSADRDWYRVGDNLWVAAQAVQTVSLPEGIPVEED